MPVEDLPPSAQAMYSTWWKDMRAWAAQANPDTGRPYSLQDIQAAVSIIAEQYPGQYSPPSRAGVSSLYAAAAAIENARINLTAADPSETNLAQYVVTPPWAKDLATRTAAPYWQAVMQITYTDTEGVQQTGYSTVLIPQQLPVSKASLTTQMELRITDQLAAPPGTGTPRSGSLDSIDSISLLAV